MFRDDVTDGHAPAAVPSRPERIAGILRQRITDHELEAGSRLPSENALAEHFGVSRAVIREAIQRLKVEGLVETLQGSGAYVRSPDAGDANIDRLTRASLDSLLDLLEVRRETEGAIAARAAARRTDQQMAAIDAALEALVVAEQAGRNGAGEDRAFHTSIAAASGNIYWLKLYQALAPQIQVGMSVTRGNEALRQDFWAQVEAEHRAIRDAIADRDPERSRAAAIRHMEMSSERTMSADRDFWRQAAGAKVTKLPKAK
jgi:DNA-binding FadR family transcriptional regulator